MHGEHETKRYETVVIGAGQAGLAAGYHLAKRGVDFVILEANDRIGTSWRSRWDSLRLFTAARYDGLPGMPFPATPHSFPTKDQVADYLETYVARFGLPVRTGVTVDAIWPAEDGSDGYVLTAGDERFRAAQVIVATGAFHSARVPDFADALDPAIRQLHSSEYQRSSQLQAGSVLVVGASHSGVEIALEAAREHRTWLSGRDTGQVPINLDGVVGRLVDPVIWFVANHVLTLGTPIGRKARPQVRSRGAPLERLEGRAPSSSRCRACPRPNGRCSRRSAAPR